MAIKPELKQAVAYNKIKATDYNSNFNTLLDYIENISEELTLKVNTINSQLSSNVLSSLQSVYPVGSIYIGVTETCPIASLFGTWKLVSSGRVLQGADSSHGVGTTIEAGLPNITANFGKFDVYEANANGAATITTQAYPKTREQWGGTVAEISINAARSSSIYKDGFNTVQPPAYVVNIWKRTA